MSLENLAKVISEKRGISIEEAEVEAGKFVDTCYSELVKYHVEVLGKDFEIVVNDGLNKEAFELAREIYGLD